MRALLTAAGTRGDVQPLFALARALGRAGHTALVAGPPDFASEAAALGVEYHGCGPHMQRTLAAHAELGANPVRMIRAARESAEVDVLNYFDALVPLAKDADVLVAAGLMFGASSVAELLQIPYRYLAYTPDLLRSAYQPPPLTNWGTMPRPIHRMLWSAFAKIIDWLVKRGLNRRRREHGLQEVRCVMSHALSIERTLLAADAELSPLPPDVQLAAPALGSLRLDDERALPHELERFLSDGSAPVYFGFGSMPDPDPRRTTRAIASCVHELGVRAIIARGWAQLGAGELGPAVLVIGEVPHRKLFPRVAAVVHHGGAGTTDAAMLAGVPQVVVPQLLDQFGWARRVHALGLGPSPLPRYRLNHARLKRALAAALQVPEYADRARQVALEVGARDGLSRAVRALEDAVGMRSTRRPSRAVAAGRSMPPRVASTAP